MINEYISIDKVIEKIGSPYAPRWFAVNTILDWANSDEGLRIYFEGSLIGAEYFDEPEVLLDHSGGFDNLLIAIGVTVKVDGRMRLRGLSASLKNDRHLIYTRGFESGGLRYHCSEETGMYAVDVIVEVDRLFVLESELDDFIRRTSNEGIAAVKPVGPDPGVRKALALLAREMAQKSISFRTGNKVNTSKVQKHIIDLAPIYGQTDAMLASIDDKLSKTMNALDLRELTKEPLPSATSKVKNRHR
jgi:hypothetical protein